MGNLQISLCKSEITRDEALEIKAQVKELIEPLGLDVNFAWVESLE